MAIEISHLSVTLASQAILRDVSFSVSEGEYVSVIGPNGAGKTTLLKCLNRVIMPAGGEISINGLPLRAYRQRDLAKVLSYVPQSDGRYVPFSVFDFVLMGRYPHLSPFSSISAEDKRVARECLELTGTASFADRSLDTLSGGERQCVFIAAALAQGATILLLDEPTTFLDYKHQLDVQGLLRRLNSEQGITIVSVTHDVTTAIWSSSRVVALKAGALHFNGSPEELVDGGVLESVYDTPMRLVRDEALPGPLFVPVERRP